MHGHNYQKPLGKRMKRAVLLTCIGVTSRVKIRMLQTATISLVRAKQHSWEQGQHLKVPVIPHFEGCTSGLPCQLEKNSRGHPVGVEQQPQGLLWFGQQWAVLTMNTLKVPSVLILVTSSLRSALELDQNLVENLSKVDQGCGGIWRQNRTKLPSRTVRM
jgi:hypothetical protein